MYAVLSPAFEIEVDKGRDLRGELARAVVHGGWTLLELRPMGLSLEEIFLELTREEAEASTAATPPKGKEAASGSEEKAAKRGDHA